MPAKALLRPIAVEVHAIRVHTEAEIARLDLLSRLGVAIDDDLELAVLNCVCLGCQSF